MPAAVIYTRVSQDRNHIGRSVTEQEKECRAVCDREGWDVIEPVFSDNDRSASRYAKKTRHQWAALVAFLAAGGADVLVCWEASRSTRDLRVFLDLRDLCEKNSILLNLSGRTYDMSSSRDRRYVTDDALRAEGESDQTRERVLRAVRASAAAGRPHGRHSYGYAREYDPGTKALLRVVVVPGEAEALQEAARRVLAGGSLRSLARDFDARGLPTPGHGQRWTAITLRRLLLNPSYAGKRVHQGEVIGDAAWPLILDEAMQARLRTILIDPARNTRDSDATRYLLTGLLRCGVCGGPCGRKRNRGIPSYVCRHDAHVSRKLEWVDAYVTEVLLARLSDPRLLAGLTAGVDADEEQLVEHLDHLAVLRGRRDEAADRFAAGEISAAVLARVEAVLGPQIEAAQRAVQAQSAHVPEVVQELVGGVDDLRDRWEALSLLEKRTVIGAVLRMRLLPSKQGQRVFDPATVEVRPR